jgi:hypothetical protein
VDFPGRLRCGKAAIGLPHSKQLRVLIMVKIGANSSDENVIPLCNKPAVAFLPQVPALLFSSWNGFTLPGLSRPEAG